jgi:hypothetical protein
LIAFSEPMAAEWLGSWTRSRQVYRSGQASLGAVSRKRGFTASEGQLHAQRAMNSKGRYDAAMRDFFAWFFSADRLREAAERILDGIPAASRRPRTGIPPGMVSVNSVPDLRSVYLYLATLSIENLLKGLWVQANEHEYKHGRHPKAIWGHDLRALAGLVNVTFVPPEEAFLDLARQVESLGRYPGPLDDNQDFVLPDDVDIDRLAATYTGLYDRLALDLMKDVETD